MGAKSGFTLKLIQWFNRGVEFACCGLILALTSYFLAAMSNHSIDIPTNIRAVEGISGIGVIYTALGVLLVCCLAGFTLTSFVAIVLDVAFVGAFIYVATVYKGGASSCSGDSVSTIFGTGNADSKVSSTKDGGIALPTYRTACKMESANLAVAIVAIVFFILSALTELGLGRHRKKEQRFGPSPANGYTAGYGRKPAFFGSLFRRRGTAKAGGDDPNALPLHTEPDQLRQSYATDATRVDGAGAGAAPQHGVVTSSTGYAKYGEAGYAADPYQGGLAPAPVGATTNGFGNVPGHAPASGRYGDGTYNV